jgi:signal transduction histidine kinase
MITVQVLDTGPGIPEDFREKIFDRFSQVPGQSGRRRGSGLGLTFCKLAVEAHGGRIWVEPRPGGGSIFTLTLPIEGPPASR